MNNISKAALAIAAAAGISTAMAQPVSAYGGMAMGNGRVNDGLVPQEMREQFRKDCANLSDEEQAALREERQARRQEHQQEMESFTGMTREQMREARRNGESIGDILESQGKTEADAESFLTKRANERVDEISQKHDLSEEQTQTLRGRIATFVQNVLSRWFGK